MFCIQIYSLISKKLSRGYNFNLNVGMYSIEVKILYIFCFDTFFLNSTIDCLGVRVSVVEYPSQLRHTRLILSLLSCFNRETFFRAIIKSISSDHNRILLEVIATYFFNIQWVRVYTAGINLTFGIIRSKRTNCCGFLRALRQLNPSISLFTIREN